MFFFDVGPEKLRTKNILVFTVFLYPAPLDPLLTKNNLRVWDFEGVWTETSRTWGSVRVRCPKTEERLGPVWYEEERRVERVVGVGMGFMGRRRQEE